MEQVLWECTECGAELHEGDELDAHSYECGNCGDTWTSEDGHSPAHKCESCGKFGSKLSDGPLCSDCDVGELEQVDYHSVHCDECAQERLTQDDEEADEEAEEQEQEEEESSE